MKQRRKVKRSRLVGKSMGALTLFAFLLLPFAPLAQADSGNLLPNGSFQSGTSGWTTTDANFTIASDGNGDNAAGRLALSTTSTSYVLTASPRPVPSTTAGTVYTASGVVRSDTPGKKVCLVLKELTSGGTLLSNSSTCTTTTAQWTPLAQVTLTAQNSGDQIGFVARQSNAVAGDSFEVDTLSLVASGGSGGGGSPPSTPTNVTATAVSANEIDVSWSASTDPDPDGVDHYLIYRDGGQTSIGSAPAGSTPSFADTTVGPGETHTYTVAAFDAAGHSSSQSTPSTPVTTPPLPGSPPSTPTNVSATAASSNEIDVTWNASTDPDPTGVGGYTIYRDGVTPLGPAGGSMTSFADTSVAPGSTHFYTVVAFDPEGHTSQQSQPSNSETTPTGQPGSVVGLWHLDETSGTTAHDSSGHRHDGAINGTVTLGVAGKVNTAFSFVPKSNVIVPNASDLIPGTANITVSYWLKATTKPTIGDYDMFTKGDANTSGGQIKIEVQQNGQASCMFRGSSGSRQLQAGPNVVDGQWHKVICQRVGNQIIETVDGASTSVTVATGAITVTAEIRLGSHLGARPLGGGDWYNGVLDEVTYSIG